MAFSFHEPKVMLILVLLIAAFLFYNQMLLKSQIGSLRDFLGSHNAPTTGRRAQCEPEQAQRKPRFELPSWGGISATSANQAAQASSGQVGPGSVFRQDEEDDPLSIETDSKMEQRYKP